MGNGESSPGFEVGERSEGLLASQFSFDSAEAVAHLRASDEALARLIGSVGPFGMRLQRSSSTFAALSEAIVHQQLNPKAAGTIYGRFTALFGRGGRPTPAKLLELTDSALRSAGLSRAKALALRNLATRTVAGEVPTLSTARKLSDEEVIERLSQLRGVGRWTAEMFLMFRLGRADVLPLGDYGMRRGFGIVFGRGG